MSFDKPTEKQTDYVTAICEVLGLDLPDKETKEAYSDFIDEHEKEFRQERYKQRYVYSEDTYNLEHSNVLKKGYCGDRKLNMNPQKL